MSALLQIINSYYGGNIQLDIGATTEQLELLKKSTGFKVPNEMLELLSISNGIYEIAYFKEIKRIISCIIYPIDEIIHETKVYTKYFNLENILVFSDDGSENPFIMKDDYKIYLYDCVYNHLELYAESIFKFFN
ncbi:MAG: SMI1/KNR4 family protein [Oscillospiraceae bacterium]